MILKKLDSLGNKTMDIDAANTLMHMRQSPHIVVTYGYNISYEIYGVKRHIAYRKFRVYKNAFQTSKRRLSLGKKCK